VTKRLLALVVAVGVLASGAACSRKNEDKEALLKLMIASAHRSGVFRYSDETPTTRFEKGSLVQVRGLIEDDFRYKARLTVDGADAIDEVVNDDALAVRFLEPSFVDKFTSREGDRDTRAQLAARYWVTDPVGAPSIGDAAVTDRLIGIDPIVDSLSVVDYVQDAISASRGVAKFNTEALDYRPAEDPFPRPAPGSGVVRWDLHPPDMPRADALETGQGNASLARAPVFRKMAVYVKNGKVVQIREQVAAKFDLLEKFHDYIDRLLDKAGGKANADLKAQIKEIEDDPALLEALCLFTLNIALGQAGEDLVRFRTMKYEFTDSGEEIKADLPYGPDVKLGSLEFFGVNSKVSATRERRISGREATTTTVPAQATTTTAAP
jgi:hypothetical protein